MKSITRIAVAVILSVLCSTGVNVAYAATVNAPHTVAEGATTQTVSTVADVDFPIHYIAPSTSQAGLQG